MGRPKKQIDDVTLIEKRHEGKNLREISEVMGVSIPTLTRRLAVLHHEKGILTKYRQLQGLQLTELQARILDVVDSKNLEDASLIELLRAFHILSKSEKLFQGKASFRISGLLEHLVFLEKIEKDL